MARTRRSARWWPPVGVALLVLGAGAAVAPVAVDRSLEVRGAGGNTPVNAGAGDLTDLSAHNSPAIARNPTDPTNVVVANRIDTPQFSCALHTSADGGRTWRETAVPIPPGEEDKCYAPDVGFDAAGTLYVSYVTLRGLGNVPDGVWLVTSEDGGESVSDPTAIGEPLSFQVRLAVHPTEPGRLYLTWLDVAEVVPLGIPDTGQPIRAATSDDGGATWSEPVQVNVSAHQRAVAPSPAVGPDGSWYVAYLDLGDDRLNYHGGHQGRGGPAPRGPWVLVVARSADGGQTWVQGVVDELVPTERFVVFLPPFPSVAVAPGGAGVHVAFHDGRAGDDADVWLWSSQDRGSAWDQPVRVNDNPVDDGTRQYLPQLAVAPDGRVDVVYYDRRHDPENIRNAVSLQSSGDGGASFTDSVTLSEEAFDSRVGFGGFRDMADLGNRLALDATAGHALAVWADTRDGTEASRKQDLIGAIALVDGGPAFSASVRTGLRVAGAGLALAGVALLATALRTRRS